MQPSHDVSAGKVVSRASYVDNLLFVAEVLNQLADRSVLQAVVSQRTQRQRAPLLLSDHPWVVSNVPAAGTKVPCVASQLVTTLVAELDDQLVGSVVSVLEFRVVSKDGCHVS